MALALLLVAGAGCSLLSGPVTFSASKATVPGETLDGTGYEEVRVQDQTVSRNFSVADQTKEVQVTNWIAQYERNVDVLGLGEQRAAVFAAFATPKVEVLGKSFNPIADMSSEDILRRFQNQYSSVSVGQQVGTETVTALDQDVTVKKYEGTASLSGTEVDVYIHVTEVVPHGDDYLVSLAIYPQRLDGEAETVRTLVSGLEHETGG